MPEPVALGIKTPDSFSTLGSLMGIAKGAQELQLMRQEQQSREMGLTKQRETLPAQIEEVKARSSQAQTEASHAQYKLSKEQSQDAYQIAGGLVADPRITQDTKSEGYSPATHSKQAMTSLMEAEDRMRASKIPEDAIRVQMAPLYMAAGHKPEALPQMLKNIVLQGINSHGQVGAVQPSYATPPGGSPVQVSPFAAPSPTLKQQVPIGGLQSQTTDALGRPVIATKDQNTGAIGYQPPPGSSYKPLMTLPPGETPETAKPLLALRDNAQAAAASVPAQHFNNKQILDLADSAFTGTGSSKFAKVLNAVGINKTNDIGADTSKLQHFIALQVEQNAAAQGANTDAARQLAAQAVLPGSTPAQAIKAITKVNDAYATGTEMFNKGMQAILNNPNNQKDVFAIRDFQNQWIQNMDPRIFQLENAVKNGDKAEVERVKTALGPEGIKQLLQKAHNLKSLVSTGQANGP